MLEKKYSPLQKGFLVVLQIVIGWHFLYEGLVKLLQPEWTAAGYLQMSNWIFSGLFQWIADTPSVLSVVNFLNIWGLILIGAALMLGVFARFASVMGMLLLLFYYLSNPPFVGLEFGVPQEGNYLVVNKNLVELFALGILLVFPTGGIYGFGSLIKQLAAKFSGPRKKYKVAKTGNETQMPEQVSSLGRRMMIKGLVTVPALGAFAYAFTKKKQWQSWEEKNLADAMTSATTKLFNPADLDQLATPVPKAKIKDGEFSRVILGGNLLSGYSHSRDLIYVSSLVKAYHNKDRIFATLLMAEKCGINTLLTNPILATIINEYWKRKIGNIQFISDCAGLDYDAKGNPSPTPFDTYLDRIKRAIDYGAIACYIQGETADYYMNNGKIDELARAMQLIRDHNVILGFGAHHIEIGRAHV